VTAYLPCQSLGRKRLVIDNFTLLASKQFADNCRQQKKSIHLFISPFEPPNPNIHTQAYVKAILMTHNCIRWRAALNNLSFSEISSTFLVSLSAFLLR